MEELVIQQGKRHGRLSEYVKSSGDTLTLGRGYDNDVILSDHFVAPRQIRFNYEEGKWHLKLLDHTNPVMLNNKPVSDEGAVINSGDELVIGHTHLNLLLSDHPVEPTKKLLLSNWPYHKGLRIALPLIMLVLSALISMFAGYQESTGKVRWGQLLSDGLIFIFMLVFWAACWALVGRLLKHKPNFFAQLFYVAFIIAILNIGMLFSGFIEYATLSTASGKIIEWGFVMIMLTLLLKYNLAFATELRRRGLISFSVVTLLLLFAFSMMVLDQREFSTRPDYSAMVKPPLAKWTTDISVDEYLQGIETQFVNLASDMSEKK